MYEQCNRLTMWRLFMDMDILTVNCVDRCAGELLACGWSVDGRDCHCLSLLTAHFARLLLEHLKIVGLGNPRSRAFLTSLVNLNFELLVLMAQPLLTCIRPQRHRR